MAVSPKDIVTRVVGILQDNTSVRWPVDELVRYLNDGQREVILHRPDAYTKAESITCDAGTRQKLPSGGIKLLSVERNDASTGSNSKRAVRLINREVLDAQLPTWHNMTQSDEILHYMFDPREPTAFHVYPPASSSAKLWILYTKYPADVTEPGAGKEAKDVSTSPLDLPDIYANALQDYVLYRAYTKDSEYAGNSERAVAHYNTFANALGIEIQATVAAAPTSLGNPNVAGTPIGGAPAQ